MDQRYLEDLATRTEELRHEGLYKAEREITSPQQALISVAGGKQVLNFCSNNYLGLANHPEVIKAAEEGLRRYGYGMASVRFICGTQSVHLDLERRLSEFLHTEASILYSSCFDANGGLFETLMGEEDAIISDQLNHASIIDGVRLAKAQRFRYKNNDMQDLEAKLKEASHCRYRLIATDGCFSMDGYIANLPAICELADRYHALVMVDDSHAVGFMGKEGRGTPEFCGVEGRVDIVTGTLGKALGGASGGYVSGRKEIVGWLRQRSRPYLFSNTLCPSIAAASLKVLDLLSEGNQLRERLHGNSLYFREKMASSGFRLLPGQHPIIPIMLGDARLAQQFAAKMLEQGVYVIGFSYPVVPQDQARIRTQMSAAHSHADLDKAVEAFRKVGKELKVI